jgi:hypothetical protein
MRQAYARSRWLRAFLFHRAGTGDRAGACHQRDLRSGAMRAVRALCCFTSRRMILLKRLCEGVLEPDMLATPNAINRNNLPTKRHGCHWEKDCNATCEQRLIQKSRRFAPAFEWPMSTRANLMI